MYDRSPPPGPTSVLLLNDDDFAVNVTHRGERDQGQQCQLTISINGEESLSFLEDVGSAAPKSVMVNLAAPDALKGHLLDAMRTKPWQHSDASIIAYGQAPDLDAAGIKMPSVGYLVKNQPVCDLIDVIRDTLDIDRIYR